jgi:hypothetical protein
MDIHTQDSLNCIGLLFSTQVKPASFCHVQVDSCVGRPGSSSQRVKPIWGFIGSIKAISVHSRNCNATCIDCMYTVVIGYSIAESNQKVMIQRLGHVECCCRSVHPIANVSVFCFVHRENKHSDLVWL